MNKKRIRKCGVIGTYIVIVLLVMCRISAGICYAADLDMTGAQEITESTEVSEKTEGDKKSESEKNSENVQLKIDNENCYEGMDRSYSDGYVPRVSDGMAHLVLPLRSKEGSLKGESLSVEINLGSAENMPFVNKNYNKTIHKEKPEENGTSEEALYLVRVDLELKADRMNGSYPVVFLVKGMSETGEEVETAYTVYVNITDGTDPNKKEDADSSEVEEPISYAPKLLIDACDIRVGGKSTDAVSAGDEMSITITIRNTSQVEVVKNMTVTAQIFGERFSLLQDSDCIYVGDIKAGGTTELTYKYQVNPETPQGQYDLTLSMDYADSKGATYAGSGNAKINVLQPIRVQFDKVQFPAEAKLAEAVEATVTAMNFGRSKIYNARATIEGDGLQPQGTIFIGDIDPASNKTASTKVVLSHLGEGDAAYGETTGTITYMYEDEAGNEYTETEQFTTIICSPFTESPKQEEARPQIWWKVMGGIVLILAGMILWMQLRSRKAKRTICHNEMLEVANGAENNG